MSRFLVLLYGVVGYVLFLATFLYLIGFVCGLTILPYTVDAGGAEASLGTAILVDVGLIALFGLQHSIMARSWFKRWWTQYVPAPVERTTFMLITCALFALMFTQWRVVTTTVWRVEGVLGTALDVIGWSGWGIALVSTFVIDHFDLFGLRQAWLHFRGRQYFQKPFAERSLYRMVRHPLMLGFVLAMGVTSHMSAGRLILALSFTAYILIALIFEERELVALHGNAYRDYQRRVPKLIPLPSRRPDRAAAELG